MSDERYAIVKGRGQFPFDMLRYDRCSPLRETDSIRLGGESDEDMLKGRVVVVVSDRSTPFTSKRWESFGWKVLAEFTVRSSVTDWLRANIPDEATT